MIVIDKIEFIPAHPSPMDYTVVITYKTATGNTYTSHLYFSELESGTVLIDKIGNLVGLINRE